MESKERLKVRDIMSSEVVTLGRNDKLTLANDVMQLGRIRHLPVVDSETGEATGIVSQRDLFKSALARSLGYGEFAQKKLLDMLVVKDVMTNDVSTISPDEGVVEAGRIMLERKIGCLLVTEGKQLVGILTESDFVKVVVGESNT